MLVLPRRGRIAGVLTVLVVALTALALVLPARSSAAVLDSVHSAPYSSAASVTVSSSNPCRHTPVTFTGAGYVPGSVETLHIGTVVIGHVTADGNGSFTITITLPESLSGGQTVSVVGPSGERLATTQITIEDCGNGGTDPGGSGVDAGGAHNGGGNGVASAGSGGLSTTGVAVFGLLGLAGLLLIGGLVLTFGGRRRRQPGLSAD